MCCGQTREHSPQSVHRPATWNARITWNIFSSKESEIALFSTPELGLPNTHFSHVQAGHTSRQALQRMHRDSSFCQNANRSSGVIASNLSTSSNRALSSTSPSSPSSSSYAACFFDLQHLHRSARQSASGRILSPSYRVWITMFSPSASAPVTPSPHLSRITRISAIPLHGTPTAYTRALSNRCSVSSWLKL